MYSNSHVKSCLKYAEMEGKNRPVLRKLLDSVDSFHEPRDKEGKLFQSVIALLTGMHVK